MGSGGIVVVDEDACIVDLARYFLTFTTAESCGECSPCREGLKAMLDILTRITEGNGKEGDLDQLQYLSEVTMDFSLCALGRTAPNPVLTTMKYFRDEYEAHIKEKRCPAHKCISLVKGYKIVPELCNSCGTCIRECPSNAITFGTSKKAIINQEKCVKCGGCFAICPFKAIEGAW
jgi:ferredoxin